MANMSETSAAADTSETSAAADTNLVPIKLCRDSGRYTDDVFVCVNGHPYLIKRGETVMVPPAVAEVLKNAEEQREKAALNSEKLQNDFEKASRSLGIDL